MRTSKNVLSFIDDRGLPARDRGETDRAIAMAREETEKVWGDIRVMRGGKTLLVVIQGGKR